MVTDRECTDDASKKRPAEWLEKGIFAQLTDAATQNSAGCSTDENQQRSNVVLDPENYRQRGGSCPARQCKQPS